MFVIMVHFTLELIFVCYYGAFTLELIFVCYYGAFTLELIQDLFGSASEFPPPPPPGVRASKN